MRFRRAAEWVTAFKVQHSADRKAWTEFPGFFKGNDDKNSKVENLFQKPIMARYIRIMPQKWEGAFISMRAGVLIVRQ